MPDLLEVVELAALVGERDDHVLEPLRPARVDLGRRELRERGGRVRMAFGVGDDLRPAAEQRVVRKAGVLDRVDELGPDLVVAPFVLVRRPRPDLEGEADPLHTLLSESVPASYAVAGRTTASFSQGARWRRRLRPASTT